MALTGQVIKVHLQNNTLVASAPVTLRNTAADYNAIDKLSDVVTTEREDGSTLIYNAATDRYEVKPITEALSITGLDGGTF